MGFSFAQVAVTALISAIVSAVVTALIAWWRHPVVRWAIATESGNEIERESGSSLEPLFGDETLYFWFKIQNIGDADAYGVKVTCGDKTVMPLVASVPAGSLAHETSQKNFDFLFPIEEFQSTFLEIHFYESPVWRVKREFRVSLSQLRERELVLSDVHLPWLYRWLGFYR